jgi:hypothetical protein
MNTLPKFNEADKYVVTAVNPSTGSVYMQSFIDGDYTDWDSSVLNDEKEMNQEIARLIKMQYPVVVTQTKLNRFNGLVDYQLVITVHPDSIFCDCGKGIICPLNKQQVNYWQGQIVTREMLAK